MDMEDYDSYAASLMLWKIVSPILMIFGTFGNTLVIIALTGKRSRNSPTSVYLSALALSDLLALNTGLLRQWVKYMFDIDVREDLTLSGCRFHWFIVYLVTQYSSWMLICVTLERLASTWLPHRRQSICNMKTSVITVITIFVFLFGMNAHYLFGYGKVSKTDGNVTVTERCVPTTEIYESFIIYSWTWIDLCVFYLIPMLVLIIGNCLIIYKVIVSHRRSRRTVAPNNDTRVNAPTNNKRRHNAVSSLTISLMLVSVVFVICITPIVVFPIGQPYWERGASQEKLANMFLVETLANLLMYVNHSINFVLYFLSGSRFRNEVKRLFCKQTARVETEMTLHNSRSPNVAQQ